MLRYFNSLSNTTKVHTCIFYNIGPVSTLNGSYTLIEVIRDRERHVMIAGSVSQGGIVILNVFVHNSSASHLMRQKPKD